MTPEHLDVLVMKANTGDGPENEWWIAQGLQYDLCVQAHTLPELAAQFDHQIYAHITVHLKNKLDPWSRDLKAPGVYWTSFVQGYDLVLPPISTFPLQHPYYQYYPKTARYRLGDKSPEMVAMETAFMEAFVKDMKSKEVEPSASFKTKTVFDRLLSDQLADAILDVLDSLNSANNEWGNMSYSAAEWGQEAYHRGRILKYALLEVRPDLQAQADKVWPWMTKLWKTP